MPTKRHLNLGNNSRLRFSFTYIYICIDTDWMVDVVNDVVDDVVLGGCCAGAMNRNGC